MSSFRLRQVCVTTNFDMLYEKAAAAANLTCEVLPALKAKPIRPSGQPDRRIVKMHGCTSEPTTLLLTREQSELSESRRGVTTGLVSGLLADKHVLFVGTSMTGGDVHRVCDSLRRNVGRGICGTTLMVEGNFILEDLWNFSMDWVCMDNVENPEPYAHLARRQDIFLDYIGSVATSI